MSKGKAVFVDRDNTILEDPGFIDSPDKVKLLPEASTAIRCLQAAGYSVVVVTNQSGVARGLFSEEQLHTVHDRMRELLRAEAADVDAIYYCPYLNGPEAAVPAYRRDSDLRKPKPGMLLKAAADLGFDLSRCWMIGDRLEDVQAGRRAGCRTVLIDAKPDSSVKSMAPAELANIDFRATSLLEAARIVDRYSKNHDPGQTSTGQEIQLLTEIRDLLDRAQRRERQSDFSLLKLTASLVQLFALAAALWGCVALFSDNAVAASSRIMLAVFLQLLSLTAAQADRDR